MPKRVPAALSAEALLAVLAGLTAASCDKSASEAKPEPAAETKAAVETKPASSVAPAAVQAKEVPSAAGSAQEKAGGCSPGGCAPGQCGGSKK